MKHGYHFDAEKAISNIKDWLIEWEKDNAQGKTFVVGLSGGKDSLITMVLLCETFGKDRVLAVGMPDGMQGLNEADEQAKHYGVKFIVAPITKLTEAMNSIFAENETEWGISLSGRAQQNIPPRARMMMLYAISQSINGRVSNNCNLSENLMGYFTIFGDNAGDFSILENLTVTEVLAIGDALGIPEKWVHKKPSDGLPGNDGKGDEDVFGFSYEILDKWISTNDQIDPEIRKKIEARANANAFKRRPMAAYMPEE